MTIHETLMDTPRGTVALEQSPFSVKVRGRMKNAFDASQLTIVKGQAKEIEGKSTTAKERHFKTAFGSVTCEPFASPLDGAIFNARLPYITETLLRGINRYMYGIGSDALETLPQMAVDLAAKGSDETGTVIRLVYGATDKMPARALSYPIPALKLMDDLQRDKDKGITPPQLQVIFANHTSGSRNDIPVAIAREQSLKVAELTKFYIKEYFPNLVDRVVFLEDDPTAEINTHIDRLSAILQTHGSKNVHTGLESRGQVSDKDISLQYGAAHLLFHDTHLPGLLRPMFDDQLVMIEPQRIINIGGKQEEFFYGVRQELRDSIREEYQLLPTVQLFTNHHVPPYRMANGDGGDLSLDDFLFNGLGDIEKYSKTAGKDLAYFRDMTRSRTQSEPGGVVYAV